VQIDTRFHVKRVYFHPGRRAPHRIWKRDVRKPIRIAVLGAGLIGQRHIQHVKDEPKAELVAIVDPALEAKALAESLGVKWSADYEALLKSGAGIAGTYRRFCRSPNAGWGAARATRTTDLRGNKAPFRIVS
jgi:hypothetical protein